MAEHTPTPWAMSDADMFGDYNIQSADGVRTGENMLAIAAVVSNLRPANEVHANARHIVHCVNVHDDLVKALEAIIESADAPHAHRGARATDHDYSLPWEDYTEIPDDDLNNARAALARAKGGEG